MYIIMPIEHHLVHKRLITRCAYKIKVCYNHVSLQVEKMAQLSEDKVAIVQL